MIDMIFPAKKIEKGSRIVIWGANIAGVCFYEQIVSLKHADVVTFIDSRICKSHLKVSINKPEWLYKNQSSYDYILIGSARNNVQNEIKKILMDEYNVPIKKIVYDGYMLSVKNSGIAEIDSPYEVVDLINKFGNNTSVMGKSMQYIVDTVKENNEVLKAIRLLFYDGKSVKSRLVCAYILFSVDAADSEIFEETYRELKDCTLKHPLWSHFFTCEFLPRIETKYPQFRYYNYYRDRKEIISELAEVMYKNESKNRSNIVPNERRIAIASSVALSGERWQITRVVAHLANALKGKGYEIAVFIESRVYSSDEFFINTYFTNRQGLLTYKESNKKAFRSDIPIIYSEGETMCEHAGDFVDKIIDYAPYSIIFFGVERTYATKTLYDLFPIVHMPITTFGSSAFFHCMACWDVRAFLDINEKYPWIDEKVELLEFQGAMIQPIECKILYSREEREWKNDDFIVITVGNRLKYDLKIEFVDAVCNEIENNETLKWVIVGTSSIDYIDTKYKELVEKKRIEYISYENELIALYKIVDAYLNPDRAGGGISIAWAIKCGLPVIILDSISDGAAWVGKENTVKGSYDDLFYELRKLIHDKKYYSYRRGKIMERSNELNDETYIKGIIKIINRAVEIFMEG